MKLKYILVYEKSSYEIDIEHYRIKVKVTVGLQKFPHLPKYKLLVPITKLWYKLKEAYIKHICSSDSNIQNL